MISSVSECEFHVFYNFMYHSSKRMNERPPFTRTNTTSAGMVLDMKCSTNEGDLYAQPEPSPSEQFDIGSFRRSSRASSSMNAA